MGETIDADICVIGAGSGGLTVAAGAALLGVQTVLIERAHMGGDCLNFGCVPSKALLAAAAAAEEVRGARRFGIEAGEPRIDFARVHDHVHGVIAAIAPVDSVERYEGLGAQVLRAQARFTGPGELEAGGTRVRARRFVIATGSRPSVPPIPGLAEMPYLTNETIFEKKAAPEHLIVIGGGPIGVELAQAHRHLGARVTLLEAQTLLANDDPELVDLLRLRLRADGIDVREGVKIARVERAGNGVAVVLDGEGGAQRLMGSDLLVATGRRPNVEDLGLEAAGVAVAKRGVQVDARLRTTNKRIYAVGDVAGAYQFTHIAGYHAGIVLRNALFRLPAKVDYRAVPWVTFTRPELAHVGLTEAAARAAHGAVRVLRWPFADNDRAQAEKLTDGLIKVVVGKRGRVLGASILGAHAGELILPWVMAVKSRAKIGLLANVIAPYPTLSEVSKRAAGSYYLPGLFSDRTKKIVGFLRRFG
ncbi:MAG TPA: FAD-dependent oxidoreductase [Alphaproteobacteria bacterium]|nr:FAD-dependent oxidoreductase [Alphaproteobacteria bacterium]